MLSSEFLCLDALHALLTCGSTSARSRLFFSLLFQVQQLLFFKNRLLVRSSLVTRGSALPDACQLRPDIALTEPEQLNNFIQLSRGSFAASV